MMNNLILERNLRNLEQLEERKAETKKVQPPSPSLLITEPKVIVAAILRANSLKLERFQSLIDNDRPIFDSCLTL